MLGQAEMPALCQTDQYSNALPRDQNAIIAIMWPWSWLPWPGKYKGSQHAISSNRIAVHRFVNDQVGRRLAAVPISWPTGTGARAFGRASQSPYLARSHEKALVTQSSDTLSAGSNGSL
jgi:hypothetical protein